MAEVVVVAIETYRGHCAHICIIFVITELIVIQFDVFNFLSWVAPGGDRIVSKLPAPCTIIIACGV